MVCVPAVSDEVENVATPLPFKVTGEPRFVPLSLNCTVPVGVPAVDETVAVKVTLCERFDGLGEEVTAVPVDALCLTCSVAI